VWVVITRSEPQKDDRRDEEPLTLTASGRTPNPQTGDVVDHSRPKRCGPSDVGLRSLKSELGVRPVYHRLEHRVDAHILVAFLAYCLQVTLKNRLQIHAPGLTPAAVLEKLGTVQMIDVWIPTLDGRWLILPRYTQPAKDLQVLLDKIHLALPSQPPPRITAAQASARSA
jgi:hypothetical protein